ncbi:MAG: ApbE family lipoprotein [Clostridia bacterium]|nr:ApbE family lipoprotein [Clostridia bacterium]
MFKRIITILLIVILSSQFTACKSSKLTRYKAEFLLLFDTLTTIIAYTESKEDFNKFSKLIYDNLKEYHELYDIYNNYENINNIKTINDNAGISPVKVDKKILDLIVFAKNAYTETNGKINIAFGSVLKIWHLYRTEGIDDPENAALPPLDMLAEAAKHTDINKLIVNEKESTVFLEDPNMSLDVGAIAKGYATEMVSNIAMENGYNSGLISVGGNVRVFGYKGEESQLWNVGIQNPDLESDNPTLNITYLSDLSLVTSGDYQRYYTVDGKRYHHIIDPETLMPSEYFTAVTIICKNSGTADALSTAVFNMPFEQGLQFIDNLQNTEALWIFKNGEIKYSANFKDFIKK